ncbi:MAG: hypothetical protein ACUVT3_10765, partial [Ignavibacterium sp.]
LFIFITNFTSAQQTSDKLFKSLDDDNSKFTNVGNIGLTVTNFGTYGHGFTLWPRQPSCEYPIGSGIEHIFDGGLWIGAYTSNDSLGTGRQGPFVTTAAVDAASVSARGGGFEFTNKPGDRVVERSALLDSKVYSPLAVSHQDFVMEYSDTSTTLAGGEIIPDHNPIGVAVHQESYSWNLSFANNFVIMNYWIKNVSGKYLDSVFIGLWTDAVVRNTNITSPRSGGTFFDKGGNGYSPEFKIAYEFDATGDIGFTDSYVGIQFLGSSIPVDSVNFVSWQFRNTTDPNLFAPQNDVERYRKMEGYFGGTNRYLWGISPDILKTPSNRSILISSGPFRNISPDDSINVVYAIITAKKFGTDPAALDNEEQKANLYTSAEWALRAYFGEDRNRNGILDAGEDLDGDGKITRYILPTPPQNPRIKVVPESQKATIYWDKRSEESIDPITGEKDFEGYRLYRTMSGFDLTVSQDLNVALVKMAEFDSLGNDVGLNTGFSFVELSEPITFPNDTTQYWYKFEIQNLLNGWQYVFSVTAFDKGDVTFNLESLESGKLVNAMKIIPGVQPTSDENVQIGVYPNPYYANAYWDGNSERLRKIYFYNLPAECEITIYTLAGDVIKRMYHDQNSNGSDLRWFQTFSKDEKQIMAGGEHAWDLITDNDQAIATGLYLFSVKDLSNGNIKTGKFLIVK